MTAFPAAPRTTLTYSEDDEQMRAAVRSVLDRHCAWLDVLARTETTERADKAWAALVGDLGCLGLPIAEDRGGLGGSWAGFAVVAEECGRAVADVPLLSTAVAVALLDGLGATDLLAAVLDGARSAAVAVPWPETPEPRVSVHGGTLTGEIPLVAGAPSADLLLVPAGDSVWAVEGARTTPVTALDMTRELGDVTLDGTSATRLGDRAALDRALRIGRVLLAAEQVGLARRALELAVGYAGERRQFGRVIGSFQANKHRLADVWVGVQKATAVARHAVAAVDLGDEQEERIAASLASAVCGRMAEQAAGELLQIHGGLGFTWENPSHLYVKRARVDALALGSPAQHRHALAEALGLRPGQGEEHRVRT